MAQLGGCAEPGLSGDKDVVRGPKLHRTNPGTEPQRPQGRWEQRCALLDVTALVFRTLPTACAPRWHRQGCLGRDGSCPLTCHHLEGSEVDVVLSHLLEQLICGESRQSGCG